MANENEEEFNIIFKTEGADITKASLKEVAEQIADMKIELSKLATGSDEFKKLNKEIKDLEDAQKNATKVIKDNTEEIDKNSKSVKSLRDSLTGLGGGVGNAFSLLYSGLDKVKEGFSSVRNAVISTGLGALVVIVASLYEYFKKTDEGAGLFAKAMAYIGAITKVASDALASLGELLINVFSDPLPTIQKLFDLFLKFALPINAIIAPVKALFALFSGDFKGALNELIKPITNLIEGFKTLGSAFDFVKEKSSKMVDEVVKNQKRLEEIAKEEFKLRRDRAKDEIEDAQQLQKIASLREIIVNAEENTLQERLKAYEEYKKIVIANLKEDEEFAKREYNNELNKIESLKVNGKITLAYLEERAKIETQYNEVLAETKEKERALYKEGNKLRNELNASEKSADAERIAQAKKTADELLNIEKKRIEDTSKLLEDVTKSQIKTEEANRDALLKSDKLTADERFKQEITNLAKRFEDERILRNAEIDKTTADEEAKFEAKNAVKNEIDARFKSESLDIENKYNADRNKLTDEVDALKFEKKVKESETLKEEFDLKREQEDERFAEELEKAGSDNLLREKITLEHEARAEEIEKEYNARRLELNNKTADALISTSKNLSAGLNSLAELGLANSKKVQSAQKVLAVAGLAIDTAKSIGNTIAGASRALAENPYPYNLVAMASVIATGLASVFGNMAQAHKILGSNQNSTASPVTPSTASPVPVNNTDTANTSTTGNNIAVSASARPQRVYLTETDLRESKSKTDIIEAGARL